MNPLKRIPMFIFAILMLVICAVPCGKAEYIAYKMIEGKAQPVIDQKEYAQIYDILLRYQFPMNSNPSFHHEENLTTDELSLLKSNEQEFLTSFIQKNVNTAVKLLWVPNILFERFTINYFLNNLDKEKEGHLLKKIRAFRYDCTLDERFRPLLNFFKELMGECQNFQSLQGSDDLSIGEQTKQNLQVKVQEATSFISQFLAKQDVSFLHCGFPIDLDPMCKTSRQEYGIASDIINHQEIFTRANFLINKALFAFLFDSGLQSEKQLFYEHALRALKHLAATLTNTSVPLSPEEKKEAEYLEQVKVTDFDEYYSINDCIAFVREVDTRLLSVFSKILSIEYEAYKNNAFVLYRGTDGFDSQLDSPVKTVGKERYSPKYLSFGSGVYTPALTDKGACSAYYACECNFFYALLVNKKDFLSNIASNPDLNLVHIHPYSTIVSLCGRGNYCHPYTISFMSSNQDDCCDIENIFATPLRPPLALKILGSSISPQECDKRFFDYFDMHVRMIFS